MSALRPAVLFLAAWALGGCGDDHSTECGGPLTCADLAGEPGWMEGSMEVVPEGFPAAPEGAVLCGQAGGTTVYWLLDETAGVHDHYRAALGADGWTAVGPVMAIEAPDAGGACETEQGFTMGDPMILVHVFPLRGAFSLALLNLDQ